MSVRAKASTASSQNRGTGAGCQQPTLTQARNVDMGQLAEAVNTPRISVSREEKVRTGDYENNTYSASVTLPVTMPEVHEKLAALSKLVKAVVEEQKERDGMVRTYVMRKG